LGDINFSSFTGNDYQTHNTIINQIKSLNQNVGDTQINVTDINQTNGTATINSMIQLDDGTILASGGADAASSFLATVDLSGASSQTELLLESENFPSGPVNSMVKLYDGTILITGGSMPDSSDSFLMVI